VKLSAHVYLDQHEIPYETREFSASTEKGAANVARVLGFAERQMVKTLIFETGEGECVLVMLPADQSAKSGLLKKALGSRNIKMASPEVVKEVTGYDIGSIPPFAWQPNGFRSLLESSLMDEEVLGVGAGQWGQEIIIKPADLLKASKARVVGLVERTETLPN
jgi:Cys-tRNA(Pro)/Cys-tRNA(Cys) deacylase